MYATLALRDLGAYNPSEVLKLPPELNIPSMCPQCGEEWIGFGTTPGKVSIFCDQNHLYHRDSTSDEIRIFEAALYPDKHLAKEVWLVGASEPWPRMPPLPSHAAEPGFRLSIDDQPFVVVRVEEGRVWLQPVL
jgi:hypothetical protein